VLSRDDLIVLVNTFREVGFSNKHRVALLYTTDPHRRARLFAFLTTLHGGRVKACKEFEEAVLWLSQAPAAERRPKPRGRQIPLRYVPAAKAAPIGLRPETAAPRKPRKRRATAPAVVDLLSFSRLAAKKAPNTLPGAR
jgi:hypothetical protein